MLRITVVERCSIVLRPSRGNLTCRRRPWYFFSKLELNRLLASLVWRGHVHTTCLAQWGWVSRGMTLEGASDSRLMPVLRYRLMSRWLSFSLRRALPPCPYLHSTQTAALTQPPDSPDTLLADLHGYIGSCRSPRRNNSHHGLAVPRGPTTLRILWRRHHITYAFRHGMRHLRQGRQPQPALPLHDLRPRVP